MRAIVAIDALCRPRQYVGTMPVLYRGRRGGGKGGANSHGPQRQHARYRYLGTPIHLRVPYDGHGKQCQYPIGDNADDKRDVGWDRSKKPAVAGARDRLGRVVPIPVVLDGPALECGKKGVEEGVDARDYHQGPQDDALPALAGAKPQQQEADDELDQPRNDDVGDLASPLVEERHRAVVDRDVVDVRSQTVMDA